MLSKDNLLYLIEVLVRKHTDIVGTDFEYRFQDCDESELKKVFVMLNTYVYFILTAKQMLNKFCDSYLIHYVVSGPDNTEYDVIKFTIMMIYLDCIRDLKDYRLMVDEMISPLFQEIGSTFKHDDAVVSITLFLRSLNDYEMSRVSCELEYYKRYGLTPNEIGKYQLSALQAMYASTISTELTGAQIFELMNDIESWSSSKLGSNVTYYKSPPLVPINDDFTFEDLELTKQQLPHEDVVDDSFLDLRDDAFDALDYDIFADTPSVVNNTASQLNGTSGTTDTNMTYSQAAVKYATPYVAPYGASYTPSYAGVIPKTFVPEHHLLNLFEFSGYAPNKDDYITDKDSLAFALVFLGIRPKITEVYYDFARVLVTHKSEPNYMHENDPMTIEEHYGLLVISDVVNTKFEDLAEILKGGSAPFDFPNQMFLNIVSRFYGIKIDMFTEDCKCYEINNVAADTNRNKSIGLVQAKRGYYIGLNAQ
jgi:hypothetical protein